MTYKAFISYSHEADGKLATVLQSALQGFAKPWYRLRALHIFRDKTSLAASAALGPSIEAALSESEYFLLLASEPAARSKWVRQEIDWWLTHRSADKMLALLTGGQIVWDGDARDFDWTRTTAIPRELAGRFADEPLYVDLRWARNRDDLSLRSADFRSAVLDIAAPLHARPKDELDGEDVRQHRRTRRLAWIVGWALSVLLVLASAAAFLAYQQWGHARDRLSELYQEQGRQQLLQGNHEQALAYLNAAFASGADGPSLRYLVARAVRPLGVPRISVDNLHGAIHQAVYSGGNKFVVTVGDNSTVSVWDVATGSLRFTTGSGDQNGIESVSSTPDSSRILTLGRDGTASLRRLDDPRVRLALGASQGSVRDARLSASGKKALTVGDTRLEVWEADTGKQVASLQAQRAKIDSASLSTDGEMVAAASGGQVLVWNADSGALLQAFSGPDDMVTSIAFSRDGSKLVTLTERGAAQLWDRASGQNLATLGSVHSIAVQAETNRDGTRLLARTEGGALLLWDVVNGMVVPEFEHGWILSAVMSPDGSRVAVGTDSGWAAVLDAATGKSLTPLVGHTLRVGAIAFSADGTRVLTGSDDRTARIWEVSGGKPVATLVGHRDEISAVAFRTDGKEVLTAGADGTAKLWTVPAPEPMFSESGTGEIGAVSFSPDGKRLVSAGYDNKARLWDPLTGQLLSDLEGHDGIVVAAAFAADGTEIATGSYDHTVRVWSTATGKEIKSLSGHDNTVHAVAIDGTRITSASADGTVRSWNRVSLAPLATFRIPGEWHEGIALSRDGRLVAMPDGEAAMRIWDVEKGTLASALIGDKERLRYAVFSPDNRRILLIRMDNAVPHNPTAKLWDLAAGRPLASMEEGVDNMTVASFSADGKMVVSGHDDGAIRVWEADTGKLLEVLSSGGSPVSAVAFRADSEGIVVGRRDGTLQLWDVRRDTRSPSELAVFAGARVRFQISDGRLLPIAEPAPPTADAAVRP